eukprot:TRINITY_DN11187_c0_g1_i1.p1 TRINITY_DN11187_c0_g1~~TRINITY_DN11187_c0_g1_i1.p1  ORF type:complete len:251 (+),score=22.11 TRINITY_DN11187_c0_g1_i1:59-811(+)
MTDVLLSSRLESSPLNTRKILKKRYESPLLVSFLVMTVLIFSVYVAALASPWWIHNDFIWDVCRVSTYWSWHQISVTCSGDASCNKVSYCKMTQKTNGKDWRTIEDCTDMANDLHCVKLPKLFDSSLALSILAALFLIPFFLSFLTTILEVNNYLFPFSRKYHLSVLFLSFVCGLGSVAAFAVGIPSVYSEDGRCGTTRVDSGCTFLGSAVSVVEGMDVTAHWGPFVGWFLSCVGAILTFTLILIYWRKF